MKQELRIEVSKYRSVIKQLKHDDINNTNTQDDICNAIVYGTSHMQEFTLGYLGESQSAQSGRQLVGQAANLTSESVCRLL